MGGRRRAAPGRAGVPRPQDQRHVADQPGRAARPAARRRPDLPGLALPDGGDRRAARGAVRRALARHWTSARLVEERRLFYVALTRAEQVLLLSGHRWGATGDQAAAARRSSSSRSPRVRDGGRGWADEPARTRSTRPTTRTADRAWPVDPLGARSVGVHGRCRARPAALRAPVDAPRPPGPTAPSPAQLPLLDVGAPQPTTATRTTPRAGPPTSTCCSPSGPRAGARAAPVELPAQLSVSQLVELAADPAALAARLRRPLPLPPNPHARRGTAFHAWLEQRFGADRSCSISTSCPAPPTRAPRPTTPGRLQEAFLASEWADRGRSRWRCRSRR